MRRTRSNDAPYIDLEKAREPTPEPFILEENAGNLPPISWYDITAGHLDDAEFLNKATPEQLLKEQLDIEFHGHKAIMRSGFIYYRLWTSGAYQDLTLRPDDRRYNWNQKGFYDFLKDHGSHDDPREISARQKCWQVYNGFDREIYQRIERIGVSKARLATHHLRPDGSNIEQVLKICETHGWHNLDKVLEDEFPRRRAKRDKKSPDQLKHDDMVRAMRTIASSETGRIGGILASVSRSWIFICRRQRSTEAEEYYARRVFEEAIRKTNFDRDGFFLGPVVDLVAKTYLTPDEITALQNSARTRAED